MKKLFFLFAVLTVAVISSCKKDNEEDVLPEITFMEPTDGQEFSFTDTVHIRANITHTEEMHEYMLILEDLDNSTTDTMMHEHDHEMNISIDTSFFPNVSTHTHYHIRVIAIDHNENMNNKYVTIHVE